MNPRIRRDWILTSLAGLAPFVAVGLVREFADIDGPGAASAAESPAESATTDSPYSQSHRTPPRAAVERADAAIAALRDAARTASEAWTAPLFAPEPDASSPAPLPRSDAAAASPRYSADAFSGRFRVTSLMETRNGAMAVIDRALHRAGDILEGGVVVETIDLQTRTVTIRTPDGYRFQRRAD